MKKYYVVLTGAMKNAGDYLITEKCKELLRKERPEHELVQLNRWEALDDELELINGSDALILMGGPAVSQNFYPTNYKLTKNLTDIKVPIVPMAVGWNHKAGNFKDTIDFNFTPESKQLLDIFANNGVGISVRDAYTASILKNQGIENVMLTGCASWYTPERFDQGLAIDEIKTVAITPAQNERFSKLSKQMLSLARKQYPNARIICSFHRGVGVIDDYTNEEDARNTADLAKYAKELNMEIADLSYGYENYQIYNDVDLHIGFRLHAHLYFLSNRKPSILLHEDGRGKSMSETIGLHGIDAFKPSILKKAATASNIMLKQLKTDKRVYADINEDAITELEHLIVTHKDNNYLFMNGVFRIFDLNYAVMKEFIHNLP